MARKRNKDEIRIISERTETEFKEIKKEKQEQEESLEEETEEFEMPELEFSTGSSNPTLQATENLEQALGNVPAQETKRAAATEEVAIYEADVYNMPDYTASYEKTGVKRQDMREAGILIGTGQIGEQQRVTARAEEPIELRQERRAGTPEHAVLRAEALDRERKLPFEQRKKYKGIRA